MDLTKPKIEKNDNIVVTKMRPIDENSAMEQNDAKKSNPLEATFVDPKDNLPPLPNVGFFKLFRFATCSDKVMMAIGILSVVVTGICIPLQTQVFGTITNIMVSYGFIRNNEWEDLPEEVQDQLNEDFLNDVWNFGIKYCIIGVVSFLCSYMSVALFNYAAIRQIYMMRGIFFKKTLNQDISWFDLRDSGQFASRMSEDLMKLEDGIGEKIPMFIHQQIAFVGCYILAFVRGWELALVCMLSLPLTSITMCSVMRIVRKYAIRELDEYGKAGSIAEEVLSAIRTVIAFGGVEKESVRYSERLIYAKKNNIKRSFFTGLGFGLLWFFIYCTYALAFWDGVRLLLRDSKYENKDDIVYDVDTMVTVFFSILMGNMNFGMATPYIENFAGACGAAKTVFSVIDSQPKIDALSEDGIKPENVQGSITFKDIHFEYPSRPDVQILQGLNLTINRGETVALVGSSGCGKSTCIQLIQRLYDPKSGTVFLDDNDITQLNVAWLRAQIGVVGQEPVLFGCSIAENIRFGYPRATQQDIENAARKANAHDFIMSLPNKYDTKVGERGTQMSGGQKQRIAIARALIRDPSILLLDEATSALDTNSEAKVQNALDSASKGRTTIIVAHRLSTIKGANKIVVISKGQVVEEGTHSELMSIKGDYYKLVTAQVGVDDGHDEEDTFDDENIVGNFNTKKMAMRQVSKISALSSGSQESQNSQPEIITDLDEFDYDKQPKPLSIIEVLKLNSPEWYIIVVACLGSIVMGTAMPLFSVIFGDILGGLAGSDDDEIRRSTNHNAILFVGLGAIVGVSTFLQQYMFGIAGEKLTMRLRSDLFATMLKQEIGWFDDPKQGTGTLCARLSTEASAVQGATGSRIGTILQACSTIVFAIGLSVYYEWRIGLATLAFSPFILIATYFERSQMRRQNSDSKDDIEQSAKLAVEVVSNIRTVVSLGREKTFYEEYISLLLPSFIKQKKSVHFRGIVFGLGRSLMFFAYAAAMVYGAYLIVNDDLDYSRVFKVSQALIMGTASIAQAFAFAPNFQKGLQAAGNIIHLLNRKPKIKSAPGTKPDNWVCQGDIDYKAVQFKYPSRPDTLVLRKLDLAIQKGETVALVGPSGCGKSTVIQLLERFYDPNTGSILLDGKSIHDELHLDSLRSQLGIVSQEPTLFDRTIEENIAYGDNARTVSKQEVIEAAKNANIHTFIASLPLGYDTKLGDKGTQLSGGQKQRVAIARALVRNPKVLLLDEATSALDTESEQIVQDALDKARKGRTCITIAHRLSTIQDADTIFVINKGKVAEIGTHQTLLNLKGIYYKLQTLQSKKLN